MHLIGPDGQSLEIRIAGYQFPMERREYDANWLVIEGKAVHPSGEWAFRESCLLTYEALGLPDWLDSLAHGKASSQEEFMEPNLRFSYLAAPAGARLRVYFELESRPLWAPAELGEDPLWVEFPISELDLRGAATSWREQVKDYPQRELNDDRGPFVIGPVDLRRSDIRTEYRTCPTCEGNGEILGRWHIFFGGTATTCPRCSGAKRIRSDDPYFWRRMYAREKRPDRQPMNWDRELVGLQRDLPDLNPDIGGNDIPQDNSGDDVF